MGTQDRDLEYYQNLWDIFEKLLKNDGLNLSTFAKKWEKFSDYTESNDYARIYSRLKKQASRRKQITSVQAHSISQLQDYIKFLKKDFVIEEMRSDESYEHWFS